MTTAASRPQLLIGAGVLALGAVVLVGAVGIPADAGYGGVGSNFLPWVVALVLLLCGGLLLLHALHGGFRAMEPPSGSERGYWPGFLWMTAALLSNAALIDHAGFVLSCTVCYALAVRGLRNADLPPAGREAFVPGRILRDLLIGLAISAPVYWMFTKVLAINLPGLTGTGWI